MIVKDLSPDSRQLHRAGDEDPESTAGRSPLPAHDDELPAGDSRVADEAHNVDSRPEAAYISGLYPRGDSNTRPAV